MHDTAHEHLERGMALLRAGRPVEARAPLRLALDLAHRSGDSALEERARSELRAAGGRPRRPLLTGARALTPSERRVAELAAAGRQNRAIAEELVVTLATVEYHLRHAYRKLGITSRVQLAEALGVERPAAAAKVRVRLLRGPATPVFGLALGGSRARSAPPSGSHYGRWESRSTAVTSTY